MHLILPAALPCIPHPLLYPWLLRDALHLLAIPVPHQPCSILLSAHHIKLTALPRWEH